MTLRPEYLSREFTSPVVENNNTEKKSEKKDSFAKTAIKTLIGFSNLGSHAVNVYEGFEKVKGDSTEAIDYGAALVGGVGNDVGKFAGKTAGTIFGVKIGALLGGPFAPITGLIGGCVGGVLSGKAGGEAGKHIGNGIGRMIIKNNYRQMNENMHEYLSTRY